MPSGRVLVVVSTFAEAVPSDPRFSGRQTAAAGERLLCHSLSRSAAICSIVRPVRADSSVLRSETGIIGSPTLVKRQFFASPFPYAREALEAPF